MPSDAQPRALDYGRTPKPTNHAPFFLTASILLSWAAMVFGSIVFALVLAALVPLFAHRRWRMLAVFALLSPMSVAFFGGAARYATGTAVLMGAGLPGDGYFNLDPDIRCTRSSSGCLVNGSEWMTHDFNNAAVRMLTALFGPQPGAYRGAFPTESDCIAALASAVPVKTSSFAAGSFVVNGTPVALAKGSGVRLLSVTQLPALEANASVFASELAQLGLIQATIWKGQCAIVAIPINGTPAASGADACIVVIDLVRGRPFAYYARGNYHQRFPPVPWND